MKPMTFGNFDSKLSTAFETMFLLNVDAHVTCPRCVCLLEKQLLEHPRHTFHSLTLLLLNVPNNIQQQINMCLDTNKIDSHLHSKRF